MQEELRERPALVMISAILFKVVSGEEGKFDWMEGFACRCFKQYSKLFLPSI
jgi:hypothetical protein